MVLRVLRERASLDLPEIRVPKVSPDLPAQRELALLVLLVH